MHKQPAKKGKQKYLLLKIYADIFCPFSCIVSVFILWSCAKTELINMLEVNG